MFRRTHAPQKAFVFIFDFWHLYYIVVMVSAVSHFRHWKVMFILTLWKCSHAHTHTQHQQPTNKKVWSKSTPTCQMSHKCVFAARSAFESHSINTVVKLEQLPQTAWQHLEIPRIFWDVVEHHVLLCEISFHWAAATDNSVRPASI